MNYFSSHLRTHRPRREGCRAFIRDGTERHPRRDTGQSHGSAVTPHDAREGGAIRADLTATAKVGTTGPSSVTCGPVLAIVTGGDVGEHAARDIRFGGHLVAQAGHRCHARKE